MAPPLASRAVFEPGAVIAGKYRIISLIGVGGVGRVYLARHIELDTDFAIKTLRPELMDRPDAVQRFAREARASVRLRSERIARVLDVGTQEGQPYFVMEYMVGCSLLELRQQGAVDIATLCEFFIQACEGLADAHAQGVVHRDVKPENLFVVRDESGWRSLKVFDFGISKFSLTGKYSDVDLAAMRTEAMMGTPHYISPEQIRSTKDVDHRTDIWSLGAVMFEALSDGVLPFREEREMTSLIAEVLEQPHRSLLDIAPNVPERLAAIVDHCLVKDRELRYQNAAEVALDLLPLAPARARASVERAVHAMQGAGFLPLNGDMESLRPKYVAYAERPSSPPPKPLRRSSFETLRPGSTPAPAAAGAALLADEAQDQGKIRKRRVVAALLLFAFGVLAAIVLLARSESAEPIRTAGKPAQPQAVQTTPAAKEQPAPTLPPPPEAVEAVPSASASASALATAAALHSAGVKPVASPKPAMIAARPAPAVAQAPNVPADTSPARKTTEPPASTKLDLRRER